MLLALLFVGRKTNQILAGVIVIILLFPILLILFDYENGWNFTTLEYPDFWTFEGFFRNLFYNGFHSVFPWTAFMLFGLWYGKQDLANNHFVKKSFWISLITFIIIQLISYGLIYFLANGNSSTIIELTPILGTDPMPPMPIYMLNGIAISIVTISGCILLARRYEKSFIINILNKTGQLALTFYLAHVIIGMGLIEELGAQDFGNYSIQFSVTYALGFSFCCTVFAVVWLKYKKSGPLEWIMRKITT